MAKKRQLNVRLPDSLLTELEERVHKTKMGMAAMVEVLLVQALQQQEIAEPDLGVGDRFDDLVKRIEVLETKLASASSHSPQVEGSAAKQILPISTSIVDESSNQVLNLDALSAEDLANHLAVGIRTLTQKKDKSTFSDWAKKHDPDSMAWRYDDVEERFYPLIN